MQPLRPSGGVLELVRDDVKLLDHLLLCDREAVDRVAHLDVVIKGSNPSLGSHGVRSRLRGTLQI